MVAGSGTGATWPMRFVAAAVPPQINNKSRLHPIIKALLFIIWFLVGNMANGPSTIIPHMAKGESKAYATLLNRAGKNFSLLYYI
jgi:hypothetical protein